MDQNNIYQIIISGTSEELKGALGSKLFGVNDDIDGHPPLHVAARRGDLDKCRVLLEFDVDVNQKVPGGYCDTPLHLTARCEHAELCEFLLSLGADVHARNNTFKTPLHYAANTLCQRLKYC